MRGGLRPSEEGWGDLAHILDVRAMLGTAEATLRGAIAREETRGAHNRSDFPELDPEMEVNFIVGRGSHARMALERAPARRAAARNPTIPRADYHLPAGVPSGSHRLDQSACKSLDSRSILDLVRVMA